MICFRVKVHRVLSSEPLTSHWPELSATPVLPSSLWSWSVSSSGTSPSSALPLNLLWVHLGLQRLLVLPEPMLVLVVVMVAVVVVTEGAALRNRNRPPLRTKLPRPRPRFSTHRLSLSPSLSSCCKTEKWLPKWSESSKMETLCALFFYFSNHFSSKVHLFCMGGYNCLNTAWSKQNNNNYSLLEGQHFDLPWSIAYS